MPGLWLGPFPFEAFGFFCHAERNNYFEALCFQTYPYSGAALETYASRRSIYTSRYHTV